jgi:hypothetical protein
LGFLSLTAWRAVSPRDAVASETIMSDQATTFEAYMQAGIPGEPHRRLDAFVGTWDTRTTAWLDPAAPPMESSGRVVKRWTLDGRFLLEEMEAADPMGRPYTGIGYVGYNNGTELYEGVWLSSVQTGMITYEGVFDPSSRTFTYTGTESDPTGGPSVPFRVIVRLEGPDRHVLSQSYLLPDGSEQRAFEIVHTRARA